MQTKSWFCKIGFVNELNTRGQCLVGSHLNILTFVVSFYVQARCRFTRASNVDGSGKENSPQLQPKKQVFMRRQLSNDSPPGPMHGLAAAATSSPAFCSVRRPSGLLLSPTIASSPVLPQFAASASSAFIAVQQGPGDEPELRVSPRDGGSTPEKSSVPGSIASLSARTAPRPSSSLPFYRNRHPSADDDDMFNQQNRPLKRSLDSANTSLTAASSKRVKCSDSFSEARSTRRKMAFGSNERKTKSAEAAFMTSSPMSDLKPGFRPISAPAQMVSIVRSFSSPQARSQVLMFGGKYIFRGGQIFFSGHNKIGWGKKLMEGTASNDTCFHGPASPPLLCDLV